MNQIISYLRKLATPPPTTDDAKLRRIVYPLYFTLWALFLASFGLGLIGFIQSGNLEGGKGASLAIALLFGLAIFAIQRGYFNVVRFALPLVIWAGLNYTIATDAGVRDVDISGLALVIAVAGLLASAKTAVLFGGLSIGTVLVLYWLEINGRFVSPYQTVVRFEEAGIVVAILIIVTLLIYYAVDYMDRSTERTQLDAELLEQRNEALQQAQASLQEQAAALQRENEERQRAEEALKLSEAKNRAILDYMPDMILRLNADGYFVDFSPSNNIDPVAPPDFFIGKHITELLPPEVARPGVDALEKALATNEVHAFEYPMIVGTEERIFESRNVPIPGREVITIVRDITDERRNEEAALQAQKLESIGLLAGGIAHDFNNLLTGMMGQNSLALAKLPANSPARRHLEKSVVSAKRAADLTRQLLAYAGKGQFLIEPIDVNQLVVEGAGLLETVLPKQARLLLELASSLPTIEADRGQIQQILMNLVINAAEAIGEAGGMVTVQTSLVALTAVIDSTDFVLQQEIIPGNYVCLRVSDTGRGVSDADKKRIFDPYYSTKGQGRGLGLSATLGIIHSYQGYLRLSSRVGEGSDFYIYFPASLHEDAEETGSFAPVTASVGNVLIVDDEEDVRQTAADILEMAGFQVMMAHDGQHGVAQFAQRHQQIDVVLLDVHMPIMNGEQAFYELRKIAPTVPIIFSSGYSEITLPSLADQENVYFLQKPYDIDKLIEKVQQVLGQPAAISQE